MQQDLYPKFGISNPPYLHVFGPGEHPNSTQKGPLTQFLRPVATFLEESKSHLPLNIFPFF